MTYSPSLLPKLVLSSSSAPMVQIERSISIIFQSSLVTKSKRTSFSIVPNIPRIISTSWYIPSLRQPSHLPITPLRRPPNLPSHPVTRRRSTPNLMLVFPLNTSPDLPSNPFLLLSNVPLVVPLHSLLVSVFCFKDAGLNYAPSYFLWSLLPSVSSISGARGPDGESGDRSHTRPSFTHLGFW